MAKVLKHFVLAVVLSMFCHKTAISQQQTMGTPSLATGSTVAQPSDVLPPDFRGEITYRGSYSGQVLTKADRMRNLSVEEALRSVTSSRSLPLNGEYQLTVRYEGNQVAGAWTTRSATGPNGASIDPGRFTGTRIGSLCTIYTTGVGGPPAEIYCGRNRWESVNDNVSNPQGHTVSLRIVATQTNILDFGEQERIAAVRAAERDRARALEAAAAAERSRAQQTYRQQLQQECERGRSESCLDLADIFWNGDEVARDYAVSTRLYEKACGLRDAVGCFHLGVALYQAKGVAQDLTRAASLFREACDDEVYEGCINLGVAYETGNGVVRNITNAYEFYGRACEAGMENACQRQRNLSAAE